MNKQELKAFKPYNPGPKKDLPPSRDMPKRVTRQSAPSALPAASPPPAKETPEKGEGAMEDTLTDEKEEPVQVELSVSKTFLTPFIPADPVTAPTQARSYRQLQRGSNPPHSQTCSFSNRVFQSSHEYPAYSA